MMVLIGQGLYAAHFCGRHEDQPNSRPAAFDGHDAVFCAQRLRDVGEFMRSRFASGSGLRSGASASRALLGCIRSIFAIGLFILLWEHWAKLPTELPDAWLFIPLMQAWIPGSIPASAAFAIPQLGHTWSISVEMFLYLCFPAIALLMIGVRSKPVLLGFALLNALSSLSEFGAMSTTSGPGRTPRARPLTGGREYVDRLLFADNPHQ